MTEHESDGVQLRRDASGTRSSTGVTREVVATALAAADPAAAAEVVAERDWRKRYVRHVVALTAAGARSSRACLDVARAGLDAVATRVTLVRDGEERPVPEVLRTHREGRLGTVEVRGEGERVRELAVPYRGEVLRGDALLRRLDAWVAAGVVEPSCREAVGRVVAEPGWLDLSDRAVAVLGAGAEMGPVEQLSAWGATVLAVDVPSERVWDRVTAHARAGAGRLLAPGDGTPGADLLTQTPEVSAWLEAAARDLPLTVGSYAYADGGTHLRLAAAADALVVDLLARRPGTGYAELATPTDAFVVPPEVVAAARARQGRRLVGALSRGALYAPSYATTVRTDAGTEVGVADSLVPQQGPSYALAKRVQRWRALVARADGVPVSANVAPATRTRSVTRNPLLAAAYAGAHRFGVEVFEPETSRPLMAALLVHDLRAPAVPEEHPEDLLVHGAAHGGLWRLPYVPRSVLGLAAVAGAPSIARNRRSR